MKLTYEGIESKKDWEEKGIRLPSYPVREIAQNTAKEPVWLHFGCGNIFRIFLGGLADRLIADGVSDKGIVCAETFDYEIIDKIYRPFDNLVLAVTLEPDGNIRKEVYGSITEAVKADSTEEASWKRLCEIARAESLQMISFTITEKGYALRDAKGEYFPSVLSDSEKGPGRTVTAMGTVGSLLYERFLNGKAPVALVSMDNCSHNGEKLRGSLLELCGLWLKNGLVSEEFYAYISDESQVSFPWTMIDKITPRPADSVREALEKDGVEDMQPVVTGKNTYIAPFVNAEAPQYLVVEDRFPNGRPLLEKAGVYFTDRKTVNEVERMKVTTCLNPLHTGLAVYGCLLGYHRIFEEMKDKDLTALVNRIGHVEGMPVVTDPGILSPEAFLNEVIEDRLTNPFIPDEPQRIACDTSQKVGIRFGETIKSYVERYGDAAKLLAIPVAIAGWCRYLLGIDDEGKEFPLSPDPMIPELTGILSEIEPGKPETYHGQLRQILSNRNIFGSDLYEAGIGEKIEEIFKEELEGPGAVRKTLHKYMTEE